MDATANITYLKAADLEAAQQALTMEEIHQAVSRAWTEIRSGQARGGKAVLSLGEEEFWSTPDFAAFREEFADERLGCGLRVSLRRTPNARREKRHPQPNRSPHHASPHCLAAALICSGCRISFCTRQFRISAT